jgi:hypothetical protein
MHVLHTDCINQWVSAVHNVLMNTDVHGRTAIGRGEGGPEGYGYREGNNIQFVKAITSMFYHSAALVLQPYFIDTTDVTSNGIIDVTRNSHVRSQKAG